MVKRTEQSEIPVCDCFTESVIAMEDKTMTQNEILAQKFATAEGVGDCLLTSREVGLIIGKSAIAIAADLCRNKFPITPVKLGNRNRFRLSDVRAFLAGTGERVGR